MASFTQLAKGNWQVVISLGYDDTGKRTRLKNKASRQRKKQKFLLRKH